MRELSLFTGAGGGILGTKLLGWTPIGYVEWDDYCQRILRQRMKEGHIETAPLFGDIQTFLSEGYAERYRGLVDVITAGFPCQPFSVAGKQKGEHDSRNMWPATIECIRLVRPRYALLENVPGLLTSGYFGRILRDLVESGYDCRWRVLSAAEVGAPHKRDRLWIMAYTSSTRARDIAREADTNRGRGTRGDEQALRQAHGSDGSDRIESAGILEELADTDMSGSGASRCRTDGNRSQKEQERTDEPQHEPSGQCENVADTTSKRQQRQGRPINALYTAKESKGQGNHPIANTGWGVEPDVGRVANGVASRVDRLKAIGNGQVPAVVRAAWELLSDASIR